MSVATMPLPSVAELAAPHSTRGALLAALQSQGQSKYKRYNGLPLRYAGGKSLAVGYVIQHLPDSVSHLVSPFVGGGSVEVACARELGIEVQAYDIFDILTNYWQVQLRTPARLADRIAEWNADAQTYAQVKQRLQEHWRGVQPITDSLELAAHYWYNHNLSYGPGFLGWMSKIYQDPIRYHRLLDKVRHFHCPKLQVRQGSFEEVLAQHPHAFLYCDPPYYLEGDSRMFRGIYPQRNFPVHHDSFSHALLRDMLYAHAGGFILSYNDCTTIREWYKDFKIVEVAWQYTLGQGETRIGKNRIENGCEHNIKTSHEILIIGDPAMNRRRAMSSAAAQRVKVSGHTNEEHFAEVIGGQVNRGSHTDKKDVIDQQHRSHSVKAGTWWQIFLYGEERLKTNTIFQGMGNIAPIMVECLNAYPPTFAEYRQDKAAAKQSLRPHMRALLAELQKPKIFAAFLDKAMFDGGNADYLSIYLGAAATPSRHKHFHIFHKDDVIKALVDDVTLANSQARNANQTSEQKVVFCSALNGKQIGEIEDRHDSATHYREMKFRLNAASVFNILTTAIDKPAPKLARERATTYGRAVRMFK